MSYIFPSSPKIPHPQDLTQLSEATLHLAYKGFTENERPLLPPPYRWESEALNYSDIYLRPREGCLPHRANAYTGVSLGGAIFGLPVMPANMAACIDIPNARWLSDNNMFYVMHRFGHDQIEFVKQAQAWRTVSISIGVNQSDKDLILQIAKENLRVDYITIDIAHGHSGLMCQMLLFLKELYKNRIKPYIIAGNVATGAGVIALAKWGASAVKVGIGGGGACSTKNKTGFHVPMFSCVLECVNAAAVYCEKERRTYDNIWADLEENGEQHAIMPRKELVTHIPIIADGGIRENGDIPKALVAGADMVMAGGLFTACVDSPAENIGGGSGGPISKRYYGSASAKNKGMNKHIEGFVTDIPCNGMTYAEKTNEIKEDLQSAISYGGGCDLSILKKVEWVKV